MEQSALDALSMTDREIAEEVGVGERTVRRWRKTGRMTKKHRHKLGALCKARGVLLVGYGESLLES